MGRPRGAERNAAVKAQRAGKSGPLAFAMRDDQVKPGGGGVFGGG